MIHIMGPPREGITTPNGVLCIDVPKKLWDDLPAGAAVFHPGLDRDAPARAACSDCGWVVPEDA